MDICIVKWLIRAILHLEDDTKTIYKDGVPLLYGNQNTGTTVNGVIVVPPTLQLLSQKYFCQSTIYDKHRLRFFTMTV